MATTVEVKRSGSESNANVIRRFTKRVQTSGALRRARDLQYAERVQSTLKKKRSALKRLTKRKEIEKLKKLGKIKDATFYKKS